MKTIETDELSELRAENQLLRELALERHAWRERAQALETIRSVALWASAEMLARRAEEHPDPNVRQDLERYVLDAAKAGRVGLAVHPDGLIDVELDGQPCIGLSFRLVPQSEAEAGDGHA